MFLWVLVLFEQFSVNFGWFFLVGTQLPYLHCFGDMRKFEEKVEFLVFLIRKSIFEVEKVFQSARFFIKKLVFRSKVPFFKKRLKCRSLFNFIVVFVVFFFTFWALLRHILCRSFGDIRNFEEKVGFWMFLISKGMFKVGKYGFWVSLDAPDFS